MIGCTKLLCGTATVSEVIKRQNEGEVPSQLLQFSDINRPLVVWNTTNRCNLRCQHCYIEADDVSYANELTNEEAKRFIMDLAQMEVPVLLFSGGEPLLRRDLFELGELAATNGLRPVISSNGTLIDDETAKRIKDAGFQYVGISIDGLRETHDSFRRKVGAFDQALKGIRACLDNGIKTGIRFTVNRENQRDLPGILDLVEREGIPRFCMYHLVYAGRGKEMVELDSDRSETRHIIDTVIDKTLDFHRRGVEVELLTTDNHADGIYLLNRIRRLEPERADEVITLLQMHGGCSAGTKFANVDPRGNVHPCQFWQDYTVGNVKEKSFIEIWNGDDPLMTKLRKKSDHLKGRCGQCSYKTLCGGCRIRAREVYGDLWAEDPACYLDDEELLNEGAM
ncbi:MAG: radical SAM protein [Syntrophomonadaceae bacterium]|nr:radical SAM protein [Syntrophomonadaceae bacterium]